MASNGLSVIPIVPVASCINRQGMLRSYRRCGTRFVARRYKQATLIKQVRYREGGMFRMDSETMIKKIDLSTYKRRGMFEVFKEREFPCLSVTSTVDITPLKGFTVKQRCGFFVSISFLISKSVNLVPELRHRIINGELYEFSRVDPGFTVLLEDETFSFCDSRYFEAFEEYRNYANARIQEVRVRPDQSAGDKNQMFFITSAPWFSFTSVTHPYSKQYGSIPIVTIGKYFKQDDRLLVPVGIQVHHGVVDGIHLGKFYGTLSAMCDNPASWLV